jgi:hypothetical protein
MPGQTAMKNGLELIARRGRGRTAQSCGHASAFFELMQRFKKAPVNTFDGSSFRQQKSDCKNDLLGPVFVFLLAMRPCLWKKQISRLPNRYQNHYLSNLSSPDPFSEKSRASIRITATGVSEMWLSLGVMGLRS